MPWIMSLKCNMEIDKNYEEVNQYMHQQTMNEEAHIYKIVFLIVNFT